MTTINDEATALLAEAMATTCSDPWECPHGTERNHGATDILAASPTLAADLEFAAAWRRVERALPDGWWFGGCQRYGGGWSAAAWGPAPDWDKTVAVGTTRTAALETLAEMLEATR